VKVSDVVVENFRPGTMKRLGLDYEVLRHVNPGLVYATISGYGRRSDLSGPYSDWPANNPSAQAMSGIMDVTGEPGAPPSLVGASVGDTIPALWTAYGIMLALAQRRQTGKGQHVDISMYDCLLLHNDVAVPYYNLYGKVSGRNREDMWSAQLRLEAEDGFVVISGSVPRESWTKLWRAAGRDELSLDPKYLGYKIDGPFLIKVVKPALEVWTKTQRKEELCRFLLGLGFSAAMVQTARDVFDCPHLEARQMFHEFDFLGKHYRLPGDPVKLSEAPSAEGSAPPSLGQDNADMFRKLLGISEAEIREYQALGVM
jgi:crotonobetainyl-CoA:carnitine CoA-transferase CaiB-like acyl-CoA transferase